MWCVECIGLYDLYEFIGPCDGSRCGGYEVLVLSDGLFVGMFILVIAVAVVVVRIIIISVNEVGRG